MLKQFISQFSKKLFIIIFSFLGLISCSSNKLTLCVDKFTLRSVKIENNDVAMVRGDQQKRLYGAVTIEEHKQRIGQYYNLSWDLLNEPKLKTSNWDKPVKLTFHYNQASTGNEMKTAIKTYPKGIKRGKWTFKNIGNDYTEGGRILAWRAELIYGQKVISTKESFLWNK